MFESPLRCTNDIIQGMYNDLLSVPSPHRGPGHTEAEQPSSSKLLDGKKRNILDITQFGCVDRPQLTVLTPRCVTEESKRTILIPGISSGMATMIYAGSIGTQIANELFDSNRCVVCIMALFYNSIVFTELSLTTRRKLVLVQSAYIVLLAHDLEYFVTLVLLSFTAKMSLLHRRCLCVCAGSIVLRPVEPPVPSVHLRTGLQWSPLMPT